MCAGARTSTATFRAGLRCIHYQNHSHFGRRIFTVIYLHERRVVSTIVMHVMDYLVIHCIVDRSFLRIRCPSFLTYLSNLFAHDLDLILILAKITLIIVIGY